MYNGVKAMIAREKELTPKPVEEIKEEPIVDEVKEEIKEEVK